MVYRKCRQTKLRKRKMVGCLPYLYPIQNRLLYKTKICYRKFHKGQNKKGLISLEAIPPEQLTPSQANQYNFLKGKLKMF